jgi:hypothetical protein
MMERTDSASGPTFIEFNVTQTYNLLFTSVYLNRHGHAAGTTVCLVLKLPNISLDLKYNK